ncbi:pseudouridine-5'-phosphate glycosidase [Virgisporangium aurantiacum]|uniref:Pseudouridine-5'-phosphate glycosidase n=1 Tax=Virgisporangium aurantiacum TaxID=175570 RepID=A0A8J3Z0G1_9ACTN|nr:pseudouridine-5'-phosphate glycosidase [Virgisporangium aurantiacum]GIJ52853.1 pseudouridine-5'-phosphate glycosidase [Virgisporangium aurantiacum]
MISLGSRVEAALAAGRPVVALESTIISHGLPRPDNLRVAREIEETVEVAGAVPATIGMIGGRLVVGLTDAEIEHLATADGVVKLSVRDLAPASMRKADGATTVAATAMLAARAGIAVFATGGLGGVHRDAPYDESADLFALASAPIAVVCAGVKSILDVGATLERLETLGIAVLGYRTDRFPGFYLRDSGFGLDWSAETPAEVAAVLRARVSDAAVLVANPLPLDEQIDPALHDRVLAEGMAGLARGRITGKDVTPYLLAHFHAATGGASLAANIRIILRNAELGARIAAALA